MYFTQRRTPVWIGLIVTMLVVTLFTFVHKEEERLSFIINGLKERMEKEEQQKDESANKLDQHLMNTYKPVRVEKIKTSTEILTERSVVLAENGCRLKQMRSVEDFFTYIYSKTAHCNDQREIGGAKRGKAIDGSKIVCFDEPFEIESESCNVLSFGISNEWSFDDGISSYGCQVYAFDPTMGKGDFNRSDKIHFYNLGLSRNQGMIKIKGKPSKVDRYENILKKLSLVNKTINYLKMDIEGSEIGFFQDVFSTSQYLLKYVNQIGMEIHPFVAPKVDSLDALKNTKFQKIWDGMQLLECYGFRLLSGVKNAVKSNHYRFKNRTESTCYELAWIREP